MNFINIVAATRDCCPHWISLYMFCMTIKSLLLLLLLQFQTHTPTSIPMTNPFCTTSFTNSQVAFELHCEFASTLTELISVVRTVHPVLCAGEPDSHWLDEWMSFCLAAEVQTSKVASFFQIFIFFHSRCCAFRKKKKQRRKKLRIKGRALFNLRIPPSSSSSSRLCVFACALMERQLHVGRPHEGNVVAEYWSERLLHHPRTSLRNRGLFIHSRLKEKIPHLISDKFSVAHS